MPFPDRAALIPLSRDRSFLIKASLILVALSAGISFALSLLTNQDDVDSTTDVGPKFETWVDHIESQDLIFLIRAPNSLLALEMEVDCFDIPRKQGNHPFEEALTERIALIEDKERRALFESWFSGLYGGDAERSIAEISALPRGTEHRAEFLGDLHIVNSDWEAGLESYLEEAENDSGAAYARRSALAIARYTEKKELLAELLHDPSFQESVDEYQLNDYLACAGQWTDLLQRVFKQEFAVLFSSQVIPALFAAMIWWLIFHAFWQPTKRRVLLSVSAFLLGIFSAILTLFAVYLQETAGGFVWNIEAPPFSQFIYFLAGVALREETLKLACFFPLIFVLRKKNSPIEVLVIAGMVGLGFAFQENIGYYESVEGGPYTSWHRLLTANPLHYSWTGVAGFYLYEMVRRKGHGMEAFLIAFLSVVIAHGIYNSVISIPQLTEWSVLTFIFVAIVAYQYFDRLRFAMDTNSIYRRISPMGVFIIGSVVLTCFVLIFSSIGDSFRYALGNFAFSVADMVVLAFAFLSRFRDL